MVFLPRNQGKQALVCAWIPPEAALIALSSVVPSLLLLLLLQKVSSWSFIPGDTSGSPLVPAVP